MKLTKQMQQLIESAKNAGYTVNVGDTYFDVFKAAKSGRIAQGVRRYEDGTAYRLDVACHEALTIRTYAEIKSILGIAA